MKKLLVILSFCTFSVAKARSVNVAEIILKNFNTAYPQAQKVIWTDHETFSEARFEQGDIKMRVGYDLSGNIISSERVYPERMLSPFILGKVKQKFDNVRINTITEVSNADGLKYYLTLEGEKKWYVIECDSYGDISVIEKLNKLTN